jgi:Tol biopolymer transport system component
LLRPPRVVALLAGASLAAAGCGGGQGATANTAPPVPDASGIDRGSFSPDGKTLAYRGVTNGEFARIGVGVSRSGGARWITPTRVDATDFAWLPDSHRLLIAFRRHPQDPLDGARSERFALFDTQGRLLRRIAVDRPLRVESTGLAVGPGGRTAVLAAAGPGTLDVPTDLYLLDLATGKTVRLTSTPSLSETNPVFVSRSTLAVTESLDMRSANGVIALLDLATGRARRLTPRTQYATAAAAWPRRARILYSAADRDGSGRGLYAVAPSGLHRKLVLGGAFNYPSVAPDGRRVLVSVTGQPGAFGRLGLHELPNATP